MNRRLVHGRSYALYAGGCRCDACREYQAGRNRRNRADRVQRLTVHGIRSSYDAGCRCGLCEGARSEAYRRLASEYPQLVAAGIRRSRDEHLRLPEMTGAAS